MDRRPGMFESYTHFCLALLAGALVWALIILVVSSFSS